MAVHNSSGASDKKSGVALDDLSIFNGENMQNNAKVIYYSRTFLSIIGGVIAGILGLTGISGFIFYVLMMAITSGGLAAKAKFSVNSYFDSWNKVLFDGFLGGLMGKSQDTNSCRGQIHDLTTTAAAICFGFQLLARMELLQSTCTKLFVLYLGC